MAQQFQLGQPFAQAEQQFAGFDELEFFVGEIKSRFDISQEIEQIVPQQLERPGDAARELGERLFELVATAGFNDGEYRFRTGQIELPSQERAEGEFSRLGSPRAASSN